jgi:hypothetical protein
MGEPLYGQLATQTYTHGRVPGTRRLGVPGAGFRARRRPAP